MVVPPDCSEAAFREPLLRRCPFDPGSISCQWVARLDGGLDVFAWKVIVGNEGPFVIKVELPIRIHAQASTHEDAMDNLLAFSNEGRQQQRMKDLDAIIVSSIPRMKKCFGWLKIDGGYLWSLPRSTRPTLVRLRTYGDRQILSDRQYIAIMYKYVPEGDSEPAQLQAVLDFFWRTGFDFTQSLRKENWKSGVLVDWSDFMSPIGFQWHKHGPEIDSDTSSSAVPSQCASPPSSSSSDTGEDE
ncbi:hypothetical protein N658DRAFT_562995 [Parathielavia hyrcaniae]|uniref:Uncharacterized protein n=1 Tax=Parathielavia hyrcaniae TaxID=113614 RepID=A0AAN6T6G8_9PEZI|nr:hypothetical protein N658DRAFT_562995 [Parathielavia hyrcaniae]